MTTLGAVYLEAGLLSRLGGKVKELSGSIQTVAIVTDDTVKDLYLRPAIDSFERAGLRPLCFSIPPGEESKSAAMYIALLNWLAESRLTRTDAIAALGGGVVGDLAGFAAATYLRGIPLVQIPTTLLAMVDSSIGGKTGIDLPAGKNLAGAFYQPLATFCDPELLAPLPPEVLTDGWAEVVKYGMIRSAPLLESLSSAPLLAPNAEIIKTCIDIKQDIVQRDEFDTGERQLLNFGHTVGHAIETLSGYMVSHGRAVAIGMSVITRAAVRKGLCQPECQTALERALAVFGLPQQTDYSPAALYEASLSDKKRAGGAITEIIPRAAGECVLHKMPSGELLDWITLGVQP